MGTVYAATQIALNRLTAVKFLQMGTILEEAKRSNPEYGNNAQALERLRRHTLERFAQEARAAAKLNHPNVVNIYEYDLLPAGEAYISMELLLGETLQQYVAGYHHNKLPVILAVAIIRQVAAGVRAAHNKGIIHRDLKPANIILVNDDEGYLQAKVVDFGLAKLRERNISTSCLTEPGVIIGTIRYMSPEQCRGEELDARSDIYSLGVILFELLAGHPPFQSPNYMALALMHISERPPDLSPHCGDAPAALLELVRDSLEKDPALRPQTLSDFLRRLPEVPRPVLSSPRAATDAPPPDGPARADDESTELVEREETAVRRPELSDIVSEVARAQALDLSEVNEQAPPPASAGVRGPFTTAVTQPVGVGNASEAGDELADNGGAPKQASEYSSTPGDEKTVVATTPRGDGATAAYAPRFFLKLALVLCLVTAFGFTLYWFLASARADYRASAEEHARKGNLELSLADYDRAIAASPQDSELYRLRGGVYERLRDYAHAASDYSRAIQLSQSAVDYVSRGNLFMTLKKYDDALNDYSGAIERDRNEFRAYFGRSLAYIAKEDYDRAIADCNESIRLSPQDDGSFNNRGLAFANKGNLARAISDYTQAIRLNPGNARAYGNRGHVHFNNGDYDKALADYSEALRLMPQVNVYKSRAMVYRKLGKPDLAEADLRQAASLQSDGASR